MKKSKKAAHSRHKLYQRIILAMGRLAGLKRGSGVKFKTFSWRVVQHYCPGLPEAKMVDWAFANASRILGTIMPEKTRHKPKAPKRDPFYESPEWLKLRYETLKRVGRKCLVCGKGPAEAVLHVDHIKPRSIHPELALDPDNLQVLCSDCNLGKSNRDEVDWRPQTDSDKQIAAITVDAAPSWYRDYINGVYDKIQ